LAGLVILSQNVNWFVRTRLHLKRRVEPEFARAAGGALPPEVAEKIVPGSTTEAEVRALCGRPDEEGHRRGSRLRRTLIYRGIRRRKDIAINLEHLSHLVKAAAWLSSLDIPVRLIAFPEGALQAFNDEVLDLDHATFARECAIDIPGEETEALGKIAREYDAFVMAQAKARHPDLEDRFFNVGFILNPRGT